MDRVGAYEIVHALKEGGMGEVLLGRRRGPIERLVAIKTIRAELASAPVVRAMFLDEAGILARLTHPAIATIHDFGEEGATLYLVMEYVAGISFLELTLRRPPPVIAARAIADACRGLHAAHELRDLGGNLLGVVHRDISPENLMLGFDGHVKVIDFGIALVKGRQAPVTELGTIKGKPPYMSPEQVKNEPIDRQSDVFSIAVVLHELLTGEPLFTGESIYAVARSVEHAAVEAPSRRAGALPAGLDAAVMRALERERERRTPTAAAFAEELEAVVMAAGGETLEAWAERELADVRGQHREWLASVLGGKPVERRGRATGEATAVPEDLAHAPTPAVDRPARSPVWPRALVVVLLLALVAGGIWMATRTKTAATPARVIDAAVVHVDAAGLDAVVVDAAPAPIAAPDARGRVARIDARPRAADARVVVARADAAARPPPGGPAYLTAAANPFALVRVNDKDFGSTSFVNKAIPSGKVHVQLISPDTGAVVADKHFDLAPGDKVSISPGK